MSDTGPALDPREQMLASEANKVVAAKAAASAAATAEKKRVAEEAKKKRQEARRTAKEKEAAANAGWEQTFIDQYPQYGWMLTDLDRTKYADVFNLFQRSVNPKTRPTDERFKMEFGASSWFREVQSSNKAFEIKTAIGTLDWDASSYGKLLSSAVNMGWTGDQLKQESYKQLFAKKDDGTYINPVAVDQVKTTSPYLTAMKTAKAFFSVPPQERMEKVLSGEITNEDFVGGLRATAKLKYAHLAPAIDSGQTLEDLTGDYRTVASKLLERPEADIDMSNADYEVALSYQDGSTKRMMTTGEWQRMIKSDKKYGWEKTKQAVDLGREIGLNIVKSFQRGF
jgi:hypothetical protein